MQISLFRDTSLGIALLCLATAIAGRPCHSSPFVASLPANANFCVYFPISRPSSTCCSHFLHCFSPLLDFINRTHVSCPTGISLTQTLRYRQNGSRRSSGLCHPILFFARSTNRSTRMSVTAELAKSRLSPSVPLVAWIPISLSNTTGLLPHVRHLYSTRLESTHLASLSPRPRGSLQLQETKRKLADAALEGRNIKTTLTMQDILDLFRRDHRREARE